MVTMAAKATVKIISWNVNGLKTRCCDVHYYVHKHDIDVVLLQETGDRSGGLLKLQGFTRYQLLAREGVRGMATYVRNSIPSQLTEEPHKKDGVESICVTVHLKEGQLNIVNLYVSKNCFSIQALPDNIFNGVTVVTGDLNARHGELERSGKINTNGVRFNQFLKDFPDATLLGSKDATHLQGGRLDYAFILNGQGLGGDSDVEPELLSDHFALAISLPLGTLETLRNTRKRLFLHKDKIGSFLADIQSWYDNYTVENVDKFYEDMVHTIQHLLCREVKKPSIEPRPRRNRYYNDKMLREWTLMLRRAHRKWVDEGENASEKDTLLEAAKLCGELRREARSKYWENFARRVGNCKNIGEIWKEVNKVRGTRASNVAHPDPAHLANELMEEWADAASSSSLPQDVSEALQGWEGERRELILRALNTGDVTDTEITRDELLKAIKFGKSTAPGEDGITYDILNCLASVEDGPLLNLFNLSFREGKLPRAWKKAIIIPVPKANGGKRPVSLTSCCSKMLERVILNRLLYLIGDQLSDNLYGFIKGRGTSDAVIRCLTNDADYCRVFVDLKGAFDKANGEVILCELARLGVRGRILHWVGDYLFGRRAQVCYQGHLSQERHLELGTPQGGVLSPTLFNILMNKLAAEDLGAGVTTTIYADDILLQGGSTDKMQAALNKFGALTQTMGLIINESKTKFQCRATGHKTLTINGSDIERVRSYKYLGMYVGYGADSKEAELNHLVVQCKARLQPLRSLAWSGRGVGVPVLRMMYLTTVRSVIEYANPILSCFDEGRWEKLEKIQNEAMRIVLSCPRNAMVDAMRLELNLTSLRSRVELTNIVAALRHMRSGAGSKLACAVLDSIGNNRASRRQSRRGYRSRLAEELNKYGLQNHCIVQRRFRDPPPWEEESVSVDSLTLERKKSDYSAVALKAKAERKISSVCEEGGTQIFCDGAVLDNGRAGCGILVRRMDVSPVEEKEYSFRVSDDTSSTQTELCAIFFGLQHLENTEGNIFFFIDSRSAIESLTSRHPVCEDIVRGCKELIGKLCRQNRRVTFVWVPSHVGVEHNERADRLAKAGAERNAIDLTCTITLRQIRSLIRSKQDEENTERIREKYIGSETFHHYIKISQMTDFTYGRMLSLWGDSVCMRLRLGYKYLWQLGVEKTEDDICCRLCREPRSHTLQHYILECTVLSGFRNRQILNVTDQIIWMFINNKIEEMTKRCRDVVCIIRQ